MSSTQLTILVTGGSGFIGTRLVERLLHDGYNVLVVDRVAPKIVHEHLTFLKLDLMTEKIPDEYDGVVHGVIHLAGKSIFGRWSNSFKQSVYDSRILSTRSLVQSFATWKEKPKAFISASAFGIYGDKGDMIVREDDSPGDDFGVRLCVDWEKEVYACADLFIRAVTIRTANVLGRGGLLSPLLLPFKLKVGVCLGNGEGWFPWIHVDDIVSLYIFALENDNVSGPLNGAGEEYVTQKEFMMTLAQVLHTWIVVPLSIPLLYIRFGEFAFSFGNSVKMSSEKARSLGFTFVHTNLKKALLSVVRDK